MTEIRSDWKSAEVVYIHFLDAFSHLYNRVCPSVHPSVCRSVRHTQVEIMQNGQNLNKIAIGIRKYAI